MFMVARTVLFSHTIMFGLLVRGVLVEEKGAVGDVDTAMEVVSSGALNSAKDAVGWGKPCDTLCFHCGDQRSFLVTRADDELTKNKNCRDGIPDALMTGMLIVKDDAASSMIEMSYSAACFPIESSVPTVIAALGS